jgi:hypothetical protein
MAIDLCDVEQATYDEQVLDLLWEIGIAEPWNALEGVKAERERLAQEAIPTGRIIPKEELAKQDEPAPCNFWQAEGRGGTDGARVLEKTPEEKKRKVIKPDEVERHRRGTGSDWSGRF